MIEFKAEFEDKTPDEVHQISGTKTAIVFEAAGENEIKIEDETFLSNFKENIGRSTNQNTGNDRKVSNIVQCPYTGPPGSYSCDHCPAKNIATRTDLQKHQRIMHRLYFCYECDKDCGSADKLSRHRKTHQTPSTEEFECDFENCNLKFKSKAGLRYHAQSHTAIEPHVCNICQKSFSRPVNLKRHLLLHTQKKVYSCDMCPRSYATRTALNYHKNSHTGLKPYVCKFCRKSFFHPTSKQTHERLHTGEKPYQCTLCPKSFRSYVSLAQHNKTHTGEKRFQCKICQLSFTQRHHLDQHARVHSGERPFVCNVCDYRFSQVAHLRTHLKIHTRGEPFSCKTCESTFSLKSQLTAHEKIHSTSASFTCAHCGKIFFGKPSLRTHLSKCYREHAVEDHSYTSTSKIQQGSIVLRIFRLRPQKAN